MAKYTELFSEYLESGVELPAWLQSNATKQSLSL